MSYNQSQIPYDDCATLVTFVDEVARCFLGIAARALGFLDAGTAAGVSPTGPTRAALATAASAAQRTAHYVTGADAGDAAGARLGTGFCSEAQGSRWKQAGISSTRESLYRK